jgi:hypothetical protein
MQRNLQAANLQEALLYSWRKVFSQTLVLPKEISADKKKSYFLTIHLWTSRQRFEVG